MKRRIVGVIVLFAALVALGWGYFRWQDRKLVEVANAATSQKDIEAFARTYGYQVIRTNAIPDGVSIVCFKMIGIRPYAYKTDYILWLSDAKGLLEFAHRSEKSGALGRAISSKTTSSRIAEQTLQILPSSR